MPMFVSCGRTWIIWFLKTASSVKKSSRNLKKQRIGEQNMSLINNLKAEYKGISFARKDVRKFGLLVGAILVALGIFFDETQTVIIIIGMMLIILGAFAPKVLVWPYRFWMLISVVLGFIMLRVVLTLLYYIAVTPTGIAMRLFG